jgi:hypothetical protein
MRGLLHTKYIHHKFLPRSPERSQVPRAKIVRPTIPRHEFLVSSRLLRQLCITNYYGLRQFPSHHVLSLSLFSPIDVLSLYSDLLPNLLEI